MKINERSREMRRLYYEEYLTLQQIGDRYGVSRERVRQILSATEEFPTNGKTRRAQLPDRTRRRSDDAAAAQADQIVHLYRLGFTARRIADEIPGASTRSVAALIRSSTSEVERKRIQGQKIAAGKLRASEEEMLDSLRRAVRDLGEDFTYVQFAEWARRAGVVGPQTYIHRFGSWAEARERVGLETPLRVKKGHRSDRTTKEECLAAVRAVAADLGHLPSASEYDRFRTPEMPSLATARWRLGNGGWGEALAEVEETLGGPVAVELDADRDLPAAEPAVERERVGGVHEQLPVVEAGEEQAAPVAPPGEVPDRPEVA